MADCPFCEIVAGDRDAHVVAETAETMAFLDANPAVRGHTLVVPTEHREDLFDEDGSASRAVFETVQRVVTALDRTMEPDGVSTFYTSGAIAGTVTHAHVHVLPRDLDDTVHLSLPRQHLRDDAEVLADRLQEAT